MNTATNIRNQLLNINTQWDNAFNNGQPETVAALYDEAATVMPAGAEPVTGRGNILEFWSSLINTGVSDHRIELLDAGCDGALAFQRGKWSASVTDAQGNRQNYSGNLQLIYRQQADGNWKALTHIWN